MLPAADEIAEAVFEQLNALGDECSSEVMRAVALAMIRGCCRALKGRDQPTLAAWVDEILHSEGIVSATPH